MLEDISKRLLLKNRRVTWTTNIESKQNKSSSQQRTIGRTDGRQKFHHLSDLEIYSKRKEFCKSLKNIKYIDIEDMVFRMILMYNEIKKWIVK